MLENTSFPPSAPRPGKDYRPIRRFWMDAGPAAGTMAASQSKRVNSEPVAVTLRRCAPSGMSSASCGDAWPRRCWVSEAQRGAQHSQVDDDGKTQRHRCPPPPFLTPPPLPPPHPPPRQHQTLPECVCVCVSAYQEDHVQICLRTYGIVFMWQIAGPPVVCVCVYELAHCY